MRELREFCKMLSVASILYLLNVSQSCSDFPPGWFIYHGIEKHIYFINWFLWVSTEKVLCSPWLLSEGKWSGHIYYLIAASSNYTTYPIRSTTIYHFVLSFNELDKSFKKVFKTNKIFYLFLAKLQKQRLLHFWGGIVFHFKSVIFTSTMFPFSGVFLHFLKCDIYLNHHHWAQSSSFH